MQIPISVVNTLTGNTFKATKELIAYAKSSPDYKIIYEETEQEEAPETFSESQLKEMSVPELRKLTDGLECDKRNKDSMVSAILKSRG